MSVCQYCSYYDRPRLKPNKQNCDQNLLFVFFIFQIKWEATKKKKDECKSKGKNAEVG